MEKNGLSKPFLAVITIAGLVACGWIAAPFLGALIGALVMAILSLPLQRRIERRLSHRGFAALVSILAIALVVVPLLLFLGNTLFDEASRGVATVQSRIAEGDLQRLLTSHPTIAPVGRWISERFDLQAMLSALAAWLSNAGALFVRGSIAQITEAIISFYLLFYFLRDRDKAVRLMHDWLPLPDDEIDRIAQRAIDAVHATAYGTLAVATIQGALGGVMFWILGLPTPLFWGVIMGILSIMPFLGAFIVWLPAVILLILDGSWAKAVILALWGGIAVGGIDNVLRPILMGNQLRLHTVPTFIAMLGGLYLFGMAGFFLGPILVTVTIALVEIWQPGRTVDDTVAPAAPDDRIPPPAR
ncbi:MAG: AI-2E family transporter, partial [Oricola sp.]